MQVWPVPAVGFFNVSVNGLPKPDVLQVLDMSGRLVKQFTIQNQTQQQVSGLPTGTYFVKLASDNTVGQKVIVQ
jgi:Secretion system C-terminal sorting domain